MRNGAGIIRLQIGDLVALYPIQRTTEQTVEPPERGCSRCAAALGRRRTSAGRSHAGGGDGTAVSNDLAGPETDPPGPPGSLSAVGGVGPQSAVGRRVRRPGRKVPTRTDHCQHASTATVGKSRTDTSRRGRPCTRLCTRRATAALQRRKPGRTETESSTMAHEVFKTLICLLFQARGASKLPEWSTS